MNIEDIAHKIAMFAIEKNDNVNMYSAMKSKVTELLNEDNGWQPIETAPSDGQIIIVFGGRYDKPDVTKADGEWWRLKYNKGSIAMPTHWQPLPEPPNQK